MMKKFHIIPRSIRAFTRWFSTRFLSQNGGSYMMYFSGGGDLVVLERRRALPFVGA